MSSFISLGCEVDLTARYLSGADAVIVELAPAGSLSRLASLQLTVDEAHSLIDALQEALRTAARAQVRWIHRDEEEIRSAAEVREGL